MPGDKRNPGLELDVKWEEISQLSFSSILPKLPHSPNTGYDKEIDDFYLLQRRECQKALDDILDLLNNVVLEVGKSQAAKRKHVIPLFLLLGEQEDGHQPWSSPESEAKVSQIIAELYRIFEMEMFGPGPLSPFFLRDFESVSNPTKTTFAHLLKYFRGNLGAKDADWKCYPAAQHSFRWLMLQVKYPYLTDHVEGTLLPALNFFDDFEVKNKLFGIECISHLLDNVVKTDFKATSWGMLLHSSLEKSLLFEKEPQLVDKTMPELLKLLKIIEVDPHTHSYKFTLYDDTVASLLQTVEFTVQPPAMNVWLKHLTTYFDVMGHATSHWIVRILRILLDSVACSEPARWLHILKCSKVCIMQTWPLPHSESFAEIILRVIFNTSVLEIFPAITEVQKREIFDAAAACLNLLECNSDFENVREQLEDICSSEGGELDTKFVEACRSVYNQRQEHTSSSNNCLN